MNKLAQRATKTADKPSQPGSTQAQRRTTLHAIEKPIVRLDQHFFMRSLVIVLLLAAALYLAISGFSAKFNRAEVFFAECAREMIAQSNWITPLYHNQGFFDKPILTYWLIIGFFKTLGTSHFVARIPSVIASIATIAVTAVACRRLFGVRAGLLAGMSLATSFMYMSFSALCMSDMLLVCSNTIALVAFYTGVVSDRRRTLAWFGTAVAMGVGFLIKGPMAIVLPGLLFLSYLAITRRLNLIRPVHILAGIGALLLLGTPWFYMAYQANGMEAITYFFLRENLQRFAAATYDTHKPIWFMVVSLFGGFAPWSIFLPFILAASIKRWLNLKNDPTDERGRLELYLWLWVAVLIGFFSLSRGKIDYYALPVFPACAVLVGLYVTQWTMERKPIALVGAYGFPACIIAAGAGMGLLTLILPVEPVWAPLTVAMAPISLGIFGLVMVRRGVPGVGYLTGFGGTILLGLIYALTVMPILKDLRPVLAYSDMISIRPTYSRVALFDQSMARWVDEVTFRIQREPEMVGNAAELRKFLDKPGAAWVMITESHYGALGEDVKKRLEISQSRGFISRSINPGFIMKNVDDLTGGKKLLLARKR